MAQTIHFFDTSAALSRPDMIDNKSYISAIVLSELENIKTAQYKDEEIKFSARKLLRILLNEKIGWQHKVFTKKQIDKVIKKNPFLQIDKNDHRLIAEALLLRKQGYEVYFLTSDGCQFILIRECFPQLSCVFVGEVNRSVKELWDGYKEVQPDDEQFAELYSHPENNIFECVENEYLFVKNGKGEVKDLLRWSNGKYSPITYKPFYSQYLGKIYPKNIEQKLVFDLLQREDVPVNLLRGTWGSGKSFLTMAAALDGLMKERYRKIVFIRNDVQVKGTRSLGALPGGIYEKMRAQLMPLADILGSEQAVDMLYEEELLEAIPVSVIRGRSLKDCFIICDEAENLSTYMLKQIISRVGEGSKIVFCGDEKQIDSPVFEGNKNAIVRMCERLKGNKLFGVVQLPKNERSAVASLASELSRNG